MRNSSKFLQANAQDKWEGLPVNCALARHCLPALRRALRSGRFLSRWSAEPPKCSSAKFQDVLSYAGPACSATLQVVRTSALAQSDSNTIKMPGWAAAAPDRAATYCPVKVSASDLVRVNKPVVYERLNNLRHLHCVHTCMQVWVSGHLPRSVSAMLSRSDRP